MKFAAGLVIAAIAVTSVNAGNPSIQTEISSDSVSDSASSSIDASESGDIGFSSCNFGCLAVMRPVTDEDGKTYSNECVMRAAKCRGGKKTNPLEDYKRIYGKSFGASREEDAGEDSASEESGSSTSDGGSATDDSSPGEGSTSFCPDACLDVYEPVMDEDGNTYSNECYMQAAKCKDKKKDVDPLEEYKRIYGREFGAPRSGDESDSRDSDAATESASDDGDSSSGASNIVQGDMSGDSGEESASNEESTDGTPKSYCPNIVCLAVYQPVTDENGVTYSNACEMEAAKCKGPREPVLDAYKRIYGREFGAPRSGDESDSEDSGSSSEATKMVKGTKGPSKASKHTKKSSVSASGIGSVYDDGSEGIIDDGSSTASSKCAGACPDVVLPVCGSDGIKYSNPCELKIAACKNPEQNIVEDDSACSKTPRDDRFIKISTGKIGTM